MLTLVLGPSFDLGDKNDVEFAFGVRLKHLYNIELFKLFFSGFWELDKIFENRVQLLPSGRLRCEFIIISLGFTFSCVSVSRDSGMGLVRMVGL